MKHLVERKLQFPCWILFLCLAQKQVQGRCFSSTVGFRSPNFAQRWTLVCWNRINWHFGFLEKKWNLSIGKWQFIIMQNKMVAYTCKDSIFHLSVWLIGQNGHGWKFCLRLGLDSWQFAAQTEIWRWQKNWGNCIFWFFKTWCFNPILKQTYLTASFYLFGVQGFGKELQHRAFPSLPVQQLLLAATGSPEDSWGKSAANLVMMTLFES